MPIPASFRAYVAKRVDDDGTPRIDRGVTDFVAADLPPGEVEIRVDWSSVNFVGANFGEDTSSTLRMEGEQVLLNTGTHLIAARAGYNPQAAVSLWEKMLHASGSRTPEILSTHPSPETRIDAMKKLAEKYMPVYQQALHGRG